MNLDFYYLLPFLVLHERADMPLAGLTDELLNAPQPGSAHKIGEVLLHAIAGEDLFIQTHIQGLPLLWETGGWAEKIGVPFPPSGERGWDEARQATLHLAEIQEYRKAVYASTNAYIAGLAPADLEHKIPYFGYELPIAQLLSMCLLHAAEHMGEINALKGVLEKV